MKHHKEQNNTEHLSLRQLIDQQKKINKIILQSAAVLRAGESKVPYSVLKALIYGYIKQIHKIIFEIYQDGFLSQPHYKLNSLDSVETHIPQNLLDKISTLLSERSKSEIRQLGADSFTVLQEILDLIGSDGEDGLYYDPEVIGFDILDILDRTREFLETGDEESLNGDGIEIEIIEEPENLIDIPIIYAQNPALSQHLLEVSFLFHILYEDRDVLKTIIDFLIENNLQILISYFSQADLDLFGPTNGSGIDPQLN